MQKMTVKGETELTFQVNNLLLKLDICKEVKEWFVKEFNVT